MGELCGCSFSTLPGKELVCAEATRHQGPHRADGVTWPQLFPKRSEEVPDARRRLGLEGRAPATTAAPTTLDQAIQADMQAMMLGIGDEVYRPYDRLAKLAVEAAWPRAALAELAVLRHSSAQMRDLTREQDQTIQALRDKVADLEVHAAEQHEALVAIAAHFTDEVAFPGSPLGKVRDALAVQPPPHRQQLLGYQTSDGRLYRPEDITLVYTLDQGEAQEGDHGG